MSGTVSVKLLDGATKLIPSIFLSVFHAASFVALTFCKKKDRDQRDLRRMVRRWHGTHRDDWHSLLQGGCDDAKDQHFSDHCWRSRP